MRIDAKEEKTFLKQVLAAYHFSEEDGEFLADTLVDADLRGISSHGIQRITWYTNMIKDGTIVPTNKPKVLRDTPTSMLVDANKNMGQIASGFTMKHLIEKKRKKIRGLHCGYS